MIILPGTPELPPGVELQCDFMVSHFHRCKNTPMRAPRVVVPSKTWLEPGHTPLKMFTTLHFCEQHKGTVKLEDLMPEKVRVDFEATAKRKRPLDFKCDFDAAFIEWVLVTTPEYRQFCAALGAGGIMRQAMGVQRLAG
jgi:hypothetical protein